MLGYLAASAAELDDVIKNITDKWFWDRDGMLGGDPFIILLFNEEDAMLYRLTWE